MFVDTPGDDPASGLPSRSVAASGEILDENATITAKPIGKSLHLVAGLKDFSDPYRFLKGDFEDLEDWR